MSETQLLPQTANKPVLVRIDSQELEISEQARRVLFTRTKDGWKADEVTTLGDQSIFVRRDAQGIVRLVAKTVRLHEAQKEISAVKGNWTVTAAGYNRLNQIAAISPITPPTIIADGKEHPNPYVEYENGQAKRVIARKVAIGFSPTGNLVAIDVVRHYNFDAYFLTDLQAKTKKSDAVRFGTSLMCPFAQEAPILVDKSGNIYAIKEEKTEKVTIKTIFLFKKIKDIEGLWMNMSHEEVAEVYSQHIQHQRFADVIAQAIAWRNALKAHPAIAVTQVQVSQVGGKNVADVMVYGWRSEMDIKQMEEIGSKILKGEAVGVEVHESVGEAEPEEISTEIEMVTDEASEGSVKSEAEGGKPKEGSPEASSKTQPEKPTGKVGEAQAQTVDLMPEIEAIAKEKNIDLNALSIGLFDVGIDKLNKQYYEAVLSSVKAASGSKKKAPQKSS